MIQLFILIASEIKTHCKIHFRMYEIMLLLLLLLDTFADGDQLWLNHVCYLVVGLFAFACVSFVY